MSNPPPKVFLSHATADKERFVLGFATKLRQRGVDVWLDKWEMLPGDSLVDKIFDEGISQASAVIVVISANSVNSKWVREELNAGFVNKVNRSSRLIPIIIDDSCVPECLSSTIWETIDNLEDYDEDFDRVLMAIFGMNERPPIGAPPRLVDDDPIAIPNLSRTDSLVLALCCKCELERGHRATSKKNLLAQAQDQSIPESELYDSLHVLEHSGYVDVSWTVDGSFSITVVPRYGFEAYARHCIDDYLNTYDRICFALANGTVKSSAEIARTLAISARLAQHILFDLEARGFIRTSETVDGNVRAYHVSPSLKRALSL